jgi:tetratricopeptide (TPR) repeat protein
MNTVKVLTGILLLCCLHTSLSQEPPGKALLEQANSSKASIEKVDALNRLGLYYAPYDYSKALYYLQEARSIAMELKYLPGIADADYNSSRVYYYQDDYVISKKYLIKAERNYQKLDDQQGMADVYFAMGELEMLFGDYIKAMEAYQKALQLEKESEDLRGQAILLNCIAGLHREQGNLDPAMSYSTQSLDIRKNIQDSAGLATNYTSIACIYEKKNRLDSAEFYAKKGMEIRMDMNDTRRVASSSYLLGRLYNVKGQVKNALDYLNKAHTIFKELEDKTGQIIVLLEKGKSFSLLNDPDQSKEMVEKAHEIALLTNNKNLIKDTYRDISDYFIHSGDFKEGYAYFVKYKILEDSILNWRKSKLIEEMEMRYQNQQKDAEIEHLKTANQLQQKNNIILWLILIVIFIVSAFIFYLYRLKSQHLSRHQSLLIKEKSIHQKEQEMQEKERMTLEEQLEIKNRELGAKILSMLRTNEMQANLVQRLSKLSAFVGNDKKALKELNGIIRELENHSAENLWEEFDKTFQSIHSEFYTKLLDLCPDLTPSEIKIAAFLKLNLSTKEISALTFKTESGIKSTRHRLRKKLNISSEDNLVSFLMKL